MYIIQYILLASCVDSFCGVLGEDALRVPHPCTLAVARPAHGGAIGKPTWYVCCSGVRPDQAEQLPSGASGRPDALAASWKLAGR